MIKICEWCGSDFYVEEYKKNSNRQRFCSYECRYKAGNERLRVKVKYHNMVCLTCGKVYLSRRLDSVSCSPECKQKRNQQLAKERYHRLFDEEKKLKEKRKSKSTEKRKIIPMHEIEAEARKHGMNYGQYYALMLQKQEIEERERRKQIGE
jgi:hypothetical protein